MVRQHLFFFAFITCENLQTFPGLADPWIALVQRGGNCSFYEKIMHATAAGASAVIIGNVHMRYALLLPLPRTSPLFSTRQYYCLPNMNRIVCPACRASCLPVALLLCSSEIVIMHDTRPVPIPAVSVSRAVASQLEVTAAFGDALATISTGPQLTMVTFVVSEGMCKCPLFSDTGQ